MEITSEISKFNLLSLVLAKPELASSIDLSGEWQLLEESEQLLIATMTQTSTEDQVGHLDLGLVLYWLNTEIWLKPVKVLLNPPATNITSGMMAGWQTQLKQTGVIAGDGTLLIEGVPYAQFDPGWTGAGFEYLVHKIDKSLIMPFATSPATIQIPATQQDLTIAVFGDWGTGSWQDGAFESPALLVAQAINGLKPDLSIHLGDVYYAGTKYEESNKLLPNFPQGSFGSFTLNSNHEMYDGASGYYNVALGDPMFQKQQGTSYFYLSFQDWAILGLDTAYSDPSAYFMDGALNPEQQAFIKGLAIPTTTKLLVFTHHPGFLTDGSAVAMNSASGSSVLNQLTDALGSRNPDFWYYGHIHNGIVYNNQSYAQNMPTAFGKFSQLRCMGHAAIPFGKGNWLTGADGGLRTGISYFTETSLAGGNTQQANRVRNGFALVTLSAGSIREDIYEVDTNGNPVKMMTLQTSF